MARKLRHVKSPGTRKEKNLADELVLAKGELKHVSTAERGSHKAKLETFKGRHDPREIVDKGIYLKHVPKSERGSRKAKNGEERGKLIVAKKKLKHVSSSSRGTRKKHASQVGRVVSTKKNLRLQ